MIVILEQCPITFKERDCIKLLVRDTNGCDDPCDHCCYSDYEPDVSMLATCAEIHGCGTLDDSYFIIA